MHDLTGVLLEQPGLQILCVAPGNSHRAFKLLFKDLASKWNAFYLCKSVTIEAK